MPPQRPSQEVFRIILKRNLVRFVLLAVFIGIYAAISVFRGASRYSISPHTLAKVTLSRVKTPISAVFDLGDSREKRFVEASMVGLDWSGLPPRIAEACIRNLDQALKGTIWIRSLEVDREGITQGIFLRVKDGGSPEDIAVGQLRTGCALFCPMSSIKMAESNRSTYLSAQADAQKSKQGLWAETKPIRCP